MPEHTDIGARLREIRKRRGLSQKELAAAGGVSVSLIRKLEQGNADRTRLETVRKLAVALRVPTTYLLDASVAPEPSEKPTVIWCPVQRAIELPSPDLLSERPTIAGVRAAVSEVRAARQESRLADAAALLPPALRDAEALGSSPEAREVRAYLLHLAASMLTQAHQYDTAETALRLSLAAAQDHQRSASVAASTCWLLLRRGRLAEARELATKWADEVEPRRMSRAAAEDFAAWGSLLLYVSAACIRDNRPEESADALRLAKGAAVLTGRELPIGKRMSPWGPLTVAYKTAERQMVLDRPDKVLKISAGTAATVDDRVRKRNSFNRHMLDVANAHMRMRAYGQAIETLTEINAWAPEWLAQQRYARDILGDVVQRRRTLTPEMRTLADTVALPM